MDRGRARKAFTVYWAERDKTEPPVADSKVVVRKVDMSLVALLENTPLRVASYRRCKPEDGAVALMLHFPEDRIQRVPAWTFAGAFMDQCSANTLPNDRTGFKELIENKEKFDLVLCKSISHLGKDYKAVGKTLEELSKRGIYFYFEVEQLFTGDASWKVMWGKIGSLSELESMRVQVGISQSVRQDGRRRLRGAAAGTGA